MMKQIGSPIIQYYRNDLSSEGIEMKNLLKILPMSLLLAGCAAIPALPALSSLTPPLTTQVLTTTQVHLHKQNYKITKANVVGTSTGFSLLGLLTFKSPQYGEAMSRLYKEAGISEGKAQTIINVVHQNSSSYFVLFALPKITVRADFIEFTDGEGPQQGFSASPPGTYPR